MNGEYFEVANWHEFQHYRDRNPPWIKLHYTMISGETWVALDDASRVLAVACMLLASRHDGKIPANPDYVKRVAYLNQLPDFKPLVDTGFLIDASNLLASCKHDASDLLAQRQRREEKRREEKSIDRAKRAIDISHFNSFWQAYPKKVAKAAAEKAWAKIPIASHAEIMAALLCQAKSEQWTQEKGKFIPNPATWLNQRRWEDEIAAPAQAPQPAYYQPVEIRKNEISPEEECSSLTDVLETLRKGPGSHQEQRSTQEP